jgi:hypothetical protein
MDAQEEAHRMLAAEVVNEDARTLSELFNALVQINRGNGVDPSKEEIGDKVKYVQQTLVPMEGDTYWATGRVISSEEIDRKFKNLTL